MGKITAGTACLALSVVMGAVSACADESRSARDFDSLRESHAAALSAQGSAGSLATAALLERTAALLERLNSPTARSADLISRAVALEPERPEFVWVQWRVCVSSHCPDEQRIISRLKAVDPGNGLAWLPELDDAWARESPADVTAAVARIGSGGHMRIYWNSLVVMVVDALGDLDRSDRGRALLPDDTSRLVYATGLLAALNIPPLQHMSKACTVDQLGIPERRAACGTMIAGLESSDTMIMQMLGLRMQEHLASEGSAEQEALRTQRSRLHYQMMASSKMRIFHANRDAAIRIEAMRRSPTETDATRAMLVAFHLPLERPADWKEQYPGYD